MIDIYSRVVSILRKNWNLFAMRSVHSIRRWCFPAQVVLVDEYEDNHDSAKDWDSNFDQVVQIKALLFLEIEHRNEVELQSQYLHRLLEFLP